MTGNMMNQPVIIQNNSESTIHEILQELDEKITLSQRKNIVLLLGDTGTGKTTLAHFIAKDNKTLKSTKEAVGQYLISDEDGKISKKSTVSETIIPQLVEDVHCSDLAIYDCPGFRDTRGTATDISNAYSIHKIMEHSEYFKLIFVINYHSVRAGVDRHSFVELIQNVSNIIKNIGKFEKSIAAVITKVDNTTVENDDGNGYTLVSDQDMLNGIGQFLQDVRAEISKERNYYQNALSLIDILLIKNNENYNRISIFRRPGKEGNLNEIPSLQKCRNNILKTLNQNIIFTKKGENEFGYTISDESKNEIFHLVDKINIKICNIFKSIGEEVINTYKSLENQIKDLSEVIEKFSFAHNCIYKFKQNLIDNKDLTEITVLIIQILTDLNVEIPEDIQIIQDYQKQMQFFKKISDSELNMKPLIWKKGFDNLFDYINDSKEWYMFLNTIYVKLSEYEAQKDTSKFNIRTLKDLYNSWIHQKLNKTGADFKELFANIFNTDDTSQQHLLRLSDNIENIKIDEIKLRHLLNVLIYTLESNVTYINTDPNKIQIIGKYIKLSNIPNEILSTDRKNLEFFASNNIFIDQDLNLEGKEKNIIIAANEWHIINNKTINLNGATGLPHVQSKANDGQGLGGNGENGLSGLPGGPAGSFFGVGRKFINIESLTITANGGNGGVGQDGGNGTEGVRGDDAFVPPDAKRDISPVEQLKSNDLKYKIIDETDTQLIKNIKLAIDISTEFLFKIFGTSGSPGGDGGNGGCGGYGGVKGKINIIDLKNVIPIGLQKFKYQNEMGKMGSNGCGGDGGLGGYNGKCIIAKYQTFQVPNAVKATVVVAMPETAIPVVAVDNYLPVRWSVISEENPERCAAGQNGLTNNLAIMDNTEKSYEHIGNIPEIIDNYKKLLNENFSDAIMKSAHSEFITKLDKNGINNVVI